MSALAALFMLAQTSAGLEIPCVPQPLPPAIDSAGISLTAPYSFEFAAAPSLEYPRRAWVFRLYRSGASRAKLEILRLKSEKSCNRYAIESRWQGEIEESGYSAIAEKLITVGLPPASSFLPSDTLQWPDVGLDGTRLELRLRSGRWIVKRTLDSSSQDGQKISAIFHEIAARLVPASELPMNDWRTPSSLR